MPHLTLRDRFVNYIESLQDLITEELGELDGKGKFKQDKWQRPAGGGGTTRVMQNGKVFEKAAVNTSVVHGEMSEAMQAQLAGRLDLLTGTGWFFAAGISVIVHPNSPMVPTTHANFRYFEIRDGEEGPVLDAWYGGGADLTPYYIWEKDVVHFHKTLKDACEEHNDEFYPRYKKYCDSYFYNRHRGEMRGVGGVFFDYLRVEEGFTLEDRYEFTTSVGDAFLEAYLPIVKKRKNEKYTDDERYFQEVRRGRYAEFNLLWDRGTQFGLHTDGRTESILVSLPPRVRWDYDYKVAEGSREAELILALQPREWVG